MPHRQLNAAVGLSFTVFLALILVALGNPPSNGAATVVPTPTPSPTPAPGSIEGYVFVDLNRDGRWHTTNEPGLSGVRVHVQTGLSAQTAAGGKYRLSNLAPKTYSVQMDLPVGYAATTAIMFSVKVAAGQRVTGIYFGVIPASTPPATGTLTATPSVTPTETVTETPTPSSTPTSIPTPSATATSSVTPTSTVCPQTTPEPLWVEPVISPTELLAQTIIVRIGNGDAVTVTAESGVFTSTGSFGAYGNPAAVELRLLPDTTHHLAVAAHVRQVINWGGCVYGNYTLRTDRDRNGAPLVIQQIMSPDTPTPTVTPQLQRRYYLPLLLQ